MKLRNITSLFLMTSGIAILITGILLLLRTVGLPSIVIGVSKEIHEFVSPIFAACMIIHTLLNLKPLKNYMLGKVGRPTTAFVASILIVSVLSIFLAYGELNEVEPTNTLSLNNIPLSILADSVNANEQNLINALIQNGYTIPEGTLTLNTIATANSTSPKKISQDITNSLN